ncbi:CynX/NimT family MFS transporter [Noviherbaspirillum saxi]|uniref:MFS transporter n=1 Tax=Noviherbaspirillum saxi TaxID=2320863 RepID=A0A3A3FWT9_9BURK|nr:CynX/NimT family MFS transporter [Noviherbaspirillum saxi]RJG00101.1 MFS transporter [Noviherbaspirillum saxi]
MTTFDDSPAMRRPASPLLLAFTLVLVAINLRPALAGVAPVLAAIRESTGLSAAGAGGLTTLPVLCFGAIAPLGPILARRYSIERTILFSMLLLAFSIVLRIFFGLPGLFAGTFLAGASIGVVMVLLPSIIKRDFSESTGFITGLYTMALCLGAALAAGIAVPIQQLADGDWRAALGFWALPALIGALAWGAFGVHGGTATEQRRMKISGLLSSRLAWHVALFMGLQSALAYCVFGWLPTILIDRGFPPLRAGAVLSISIAAQLITALSGPWLGTLGKDQRLVIVLMMCLSGVGLMGCMYAPPGQIWLWAVLLGLGQGGSFSVGTMLVVLRSPNTQMVAALSGMTQLVGYIMAAAGPFIAGLLRDVTGNWNVAAGFFMIVTVAALLMGLGAGRRLHVKAQVDEMR